MTRFPLFAPFAALLGLTLALPASAQVAPPAPTSLPTPLTLAQAVAIALAHQPQQYSARAQTSQALGQRQQARAQYFPVFTPSYQYQNNKRNLYGLNTGTGTTTTTTTGGTTTGPTPGPTPIPGGTGSGGTTTTGPTSPTSPISGTGTTTSGTTVTTGGAANEVSIVRGGGLSLSLTQTLIDNGAREAVNAEARRAVDAATLGETDTRQATILAVTQDFYQLLLAQDLVLVAQAQVARYQQTAAVTQAQIQAGTVAGKELYQAQADLANAQVTLLQDRNQVATASAALKNVLGVESDAPVQPAGLAAPGQLPPLPANVAAASLDASLQTAYADRPDLLRRQAFVQSDLSALRAAQKRAGLSISADYVLDYQATNDVGTRGTNSQFLVTGSYPLFDAGSARGAVRIAQGQVDVSRNALLSTRQQVRLDVEQALATRNESLAATRLAQAAVTAAQVNYDAAIESRRAGVGTVLDITTAQATLTQAQNQYVSAVYNFYIADAQLLRAVGRNDLGIRVP